MTTTRSEAGLLAAERALQAAQIAGDVAALDQLLDERLIAIGPDGSRHTKEDDLDGYRSGLSVITDLSEGHVEVLVAGTTGATFFTTTIAGTFGGRPMSGRLRYMRAWVHKDETGWRILAATIVVLPPSP